ncbi:unnamed protein product [Strongylus vulgaris]|uniref:Uncharacterized protein n=1 Tax=Strongylus vulgaris TaxID=40348 RepID=A0A3P7LSP5_STRVU|nr:unnamed protein product [Strongylus vulgaris]
MLSSPSTVHRLVLTSSCELRRIFDSHMFVQHSSCVSRNLVYKGMLPDLSPHLHTKECNFLIELLKRCNKEKTIGSLVSTLASARFGMRRCGSVQKKNEYGEGKDHNPSYSKRVVELRNLPEDYWTPLMHKLKKDGIMPDLTRSEGCRI